MHQLKKVRSRACSSVFGVSQVQRIACLFPHHLHLGSLGPESPPHLPHIALQGAKPHELRGSRPRVCRAVWVKSCAPGESVRSRRIRCGCGFSMFQYSQQILVSMFNQGKQEEKPNGTWFIGHEDVCGETSEKEASTRELSLSHLSLGFSGDNTAKKNAFWEVARVRPERTTVMISSSAGAADISVCRRV